MLNRSNNNALMSLLGTSKGLTDARGTTLARPASEEAARRLLLLGTSKGLAEFALLAKRAFKVTPPCSNDLNVFADHLRQVNPAYYLSMIMGSIASFSEEVLQVHTVLRWLDSGMPVFDLTHSLMAALLLTDPADVDAEMVKLPFATFDVRLPEGFWTIKGTSQEGLLPASHALVHTYVAAKPMLCIRIVARTGTTTTWETRMPLPTTGKIGDWIADDVPEVEDSSYAVIPPDAHDKHLTIAFRRLLVNLCLYLSTHGRGEKLGLRKPGAKTKRAAENSGLTPDVWIIGREVKLDSELILSAKAWTASRGSDRAGWKLRSKYTVRGHWRNQAHGTNWSQHKLKWIAPYWKGEGPAFSHLYKVDETP